MKKVILVGFLLLNSLFTTQEAQAVENADFWYCAAAAVGFDLAAITAQSACSVALAAPTPPTVVACLTSLGATAVAGGVAYLTCSEFLEGEDTCEVEEEEDDCEGTDSPILLDLDRNQFHLSAGPAVFDIDSDGQIELITWVAAGSQDAFLYLDRNGNGVVDNGLELFGTSTLLFSGDLAENGYEALAEFDLVENGGNQDSVIDAADSVFSDLRVWVDSNADGDFEYLESQSLSEAGVLSIGLDYRESPRTDQYGNEFRYMGSGWIEVNGKAKKMKTTDVYFKILAE